MTKSANVFYTSDLHVGHRLVSALRGFHDGPSGTPDDPRAVTANTASHDDALAENWDRVVQPQDTVFVLGDISINGGQHALDWIEQRPGTKHLITGNHDPVNPMHSRALKLLPHWQHYFATIQPFLRRKLAGREVLLSHYPYWSFGDGEGREKARYEQYRLPDLGALLLHGHTHGTERAHGTQFHVGVDAWDLQLVPQTTVLKWVESGPTAE